MQLFGAQLNSDVRESVLKQIHAKGRVLEAKLVHVRWGLKFLSLGMLLWLFAQVFWVVSYARLPAR
ncbi:hypothetical protein [Prosthecobacter dejongeii]|uniref:Pycsar effector protein domain-containing protein n=1 Tax=Prosthecobacter dejongeii TaxID=48465 RepID=A0A7W7YLE8_9BACT|nr:hypothetical protein [Prosthecobacter dejongeii]MBB5038396.1 hypothetical protein [Prosthecobacter dejongeii]